MKQDIENGKINMVLTRDLSRFGRDYIGSGYYIEDYFKVNNVRFVSVLDNVDTLQEVNDIVPFKNILNEMYIKDCSKRTKDGLKQKMLLGSCISSKPPYGYTFKEEFNGKVKIRKLIPANDETTMIIKKIYSLYLNGWGINRIANYLNKKGISSPSKRLKNFGKSKYGLWTPSTIKSILSNPKYKGEMVQGQYKKLSYKNKKIVSSSEDEWIHGGEFKGIISKETFDSVQKLLNKNKNNYRYKKNTIHLFSGVLVCGDCSGGMSYRKKYKGYKCTNSQMGGKRCTSHSIKEDILIQIIRADIKKCMKNIDRQKIYDNAIKLFDNKNNNLVQLKGIQREIRKTDKNFKKIYSDRLNGVIDDKYSEILIKDIQKKQKELENRRNELQNKIDKNITQEEMHTKVKNYVDKILDFKEFDRLVVETLIDKIIVKENKTVKQKSVDIYYKFKVYKQSSKHQMEF